MRDPGSGRSGPRTVNTVSLQDAVARVRSTLGPLAEQRELEHRIAVLEPTVARLAAEQAELAERAEREAVDVDAFEGWTARSLATWIAGTYHAERERERSEALQAGLAALARAKVLQHVEEETNALRERLDPRPALRFWRCLAEVSASSGPAEVEATIAALLEELHREAERRTWQHATDALASLLATEPAEDAPTEDGLSGRSLAVRCTLPAALVDVWNDAGLASAVDAARQGLSDVEEALQAARATTDARVEDARPLEGATLSVDAGVTTAFAALLRQVELERETARARARLAELDAAAHTAARTVEHERADVVRLESGSPGRLFAMARGALGSSLERERQELDTAIRHHTLLVHDLQAVERSLDAIRAEALLLGSPGSDLVNASVGTAHEEACRDAVDLVRELAALDRQIDDLPRLRSSLAPLRRAFGGLFSTPDDLLEHVAAREDAVRQHDAVVKRLGVDRAPHDWKPVDRRSLAEMQAALQTLRDLRDERRSTVQFTVNGQNANTRARAAQGRALRSALADHQQQIRRRAEQVKALEPALVDRREAVAQQVERSLASLAERLGVTRTG